MKALITDDEEPIRELIQYHIEREGFAVMTAENGAQTLVIAAAKTPDIIILDLMLPDMNGLDVCRELKNNPKTAQIPIVMVTAKTEDIDIVAGLEIGADDYITKPFSPKVLIARVRSVLRRKSASTEHRQTDSIAIHNIRIITSKHEVYVNNQLVSMSATEFAILQFLAENPGRVFSRQEIINNVKGASYSVTDRAVDVQILSIRHKIGNDSKTDSVIETVRSIGYRMREQ